MTIVRGVSILEAPCCGERYAAPRYLSLNYLAYGHWTDGWRERTLMPNDQGLRRCKCGQFLLQRDMTQIDVLDSTDLPNTLYVRGDDLRMAIENAPNKTVELAARIEYWWHLNHPYREEYRKYRAMEEAKAKRIPPKPVPDTRSWWDKVVRRLPKPEPQPQQLPFTHPPFNPTDTQLENMARLCLLLEEERRDSQSDRHAFELAELYREQGRFDEAAAMLRTANVDDKDLTRYVISEMIDEKSNAPIRFRL